MRLARRPAIAAVAAVAMLALVSCAQEETEPTAAPTDDIACSPENLETETPGVLTVATSNPAFPPYVIDNDPSNGEGFESAVAYAVAAELGFEADAVRWSFAPFAKLFAPGEKDFDFALNQVSITEKRDRAVDFSTPYYEAANAVLVLKGSELASASTVAELQDAKIGVQVGTTSQSAVESTIAPSDDVAVFDDSTAATQALKNGQIDAFVTDLPTALYLAAVEVKGTVVGQLPSDETADSWGLVLQEGSSVRACVDQALQALTDSGELAAITDQWMTEYTEAPVLG